MDENKFWKIIKIIEQFDWDNTGDDDAVLAPAYKILIKLDASEIIEFEEILSEKLYDLDRRDIAKVCYNGDDEHFSGDDFLYSRCVVVANGKEFFDEVISNPSSMPTDMEFEALQYLGPEAYEEETGDEYLHTTKFSHETLSNAEGWKS